MANAKRGEVAVELGDRKYSLKIGFNEIAEIEQATGGSIGEALSTINGMLKALSVGLRKYNRKFTSKYIGDLFDQRPEQFKPAIDALAEAVGLVFPDVDPDEAEAEGGTSHPLDGDPED